MEMSWLGPSPRTAAEVFLCRVLDACEALRTGIWVYGGYALEAHVGRFLREHVDVDFFARLQDWPRLEAAVATPQYRFEYHAPTALHVYHEGRNLADVLLAEEHPGGFPCIRAPLGANPLPPGSFDGGTMVRMWGRPARVVTLECLFVMKASGNFNGPADPPDPKHRGDLELIRSLLPAEAIPRLAPYCRVISLPEAV